MLLIWCSPFSAGRQSPPTHSSCSPVAVSTVAVVAVAKLSNRGWRLIISSDGIWDALSSEEAAQSFLGLHAELIARQVVKKALSLGSRGLKDDTTCIVVEIIPPDNLINRMSSSAASTEPSVESNEPEKLSAPLWKYVTKEAVIDVDGTVKIGGENVPFMYNFCKKNFKGSHSRVKAHMLKIPREWIKACTKVTAENMVEMQQLLESREQQFRDITIILVHLLVY
ncbi:hypothetical protein ACLB2K_073975 [Fragaria x ananassa]